MLTTDQNPVDDSVVAPEEKKKAPWWRDWSSLILIVVGIALLAYPLVATYIKNLDQADAARAYNQSTSGLSQEEYKYWLDLAHAYNNAAGGGPILDPWLARVAKDNAPYRTYLDQLNPFRRDSDPIAVLTIPSIRTKLPVYHGTDAETLERGIGHLYGSALPVGGVGTHSILTAHSGLVEATLFDNLPQVKVGDAFYVEVMGETLKYQVRSTEVVLPEKIESLQPNPDLDQVTLITCTPYGINTHRLLVHGERVPMDPSDRRRIDESTPPLLQPWMIAVIAAVIAALILYWWLGRRNKRDEDDTEQVTEEAEVTE